MNIEVLRNFANSPAIVSVVSLIPPSVQNADIQYPIHAGLLPAGATGLQRCPGIVQPCVDTLGEKVRRVDLVVLDERDVTGKAIVRSYRINLVNKAFAVIVRRMSLSGEYDLDRPP